MAFRCAVEERVSCQHKGKLYEVLTHSKSDSDAESWTEGVS